MRHPPIQLTLIVSLLTGWLTLPAHSHAKPPLDFSRDIKPILSNKCFFCHGPDASQRKGGAEGGLRLDTAEGMTVDLGGYFAVVPGKPAESEIIRRISSRDPDEVMPPPATNKSLSPQEISLTSEWIQQGAKFSVHWSYVKAVRPDLPALKDNAWPRNEIDRFLLARMENAALKPSPEADRFALIRRVSLDLTGLPPTWEEAESFVHDRDPQAYERRVDRLLAKPAFGEHWAQMWLDLARYADSAGYADDPPRTIWLFRDYVIRSLNANKPFDQFTIEQIAGDLLANPTEEQLVATAFHRNTLTNNEGGTNDEEFRNAAIVDRVNTTMAVWMGTTIACAQCHSHKYDPLSQEEYFKLFAFFNQSEDADRQDESPLASIYEPGQEEQPKQGHAEIIPVTVPIMRDLPVDKHRVTKIQHRGNFLELGAEVTAGVPAAFPALSEGASRDRLALARWLVDENNPLTPRVIANRYWEQLFGIGIVASSEEFGSQGEQPFHPELLDWLAVKLVDTRWDMKAFIKLLVTSAAYRQSSKLTPELESVDPDNRLLARGPRFRMSAEMVRDQALAVSGLLSPKMYGPPVKPVQPAFGLTAAFGGSTDWQTSEGEDRYRRALYTTFRRSNPYPSMATFDAPNREVCTVRRVRTNTPLQALVTLNDPVYVEAAQAFARRIVSGGGSSPGERARFAFRSCLCREPNDQELAQLVTLYERGAKHFQPQPEKARQMAGDPLGTLPADFSVAELAAWTVVGNVLLNLDEFLMKR